MSDDDVVPGVVVPDVVDTDVVLPDVVDTDVVVTVFSLENGDPRATWTPGEGTSRITTSRPARSR